MDKITTPYGKTHAMIERLEPGKGKTRCGRTVTGQTGATIADGITCIACRRSMRKDGYMIKLKVN